MVIVKYNLSLKLVLLIYGLKLKRTWIEMKQKGED